MQHDQMIEARSADQAQQCPAGGCPVVTRSLRVEEFLAAPKAQPKRKTSRATTMRLEASGEDVGTRVRDQGHGLTSGDSRHSRQVEHTVPGSGRSR